MYFISETSMLMVINRTQSIMAFFSIGYIHRIQYQVECFYKINSPQNFTSFNSSIVSSSKILSTSQPSNAAQGCNHWSSIESRTLILSYQEDAKASQKPLEKKAIWQTILQAFKESCQDKAIESEEILTRLKEKWNSLVENYKKIKDNNKATRRERESFKFLEELDLTRLAQDTHAKPIFALIIQTRIPQQETWPHHQQEAEVPILMEKIVQKWTMTKPHWWKSLKLCQKKQKSAPQIKNNKKLVQIMKKLEKQKKTGKRESLTALLQGQQQMMTKAEEHDHLAYWTVLLNWNIFSANSSSVELFLYQTAVYLHLNEVTNTSNQQLLVLCHWLLIHLLQHTAQDGYLKHLSKSLFITIQCVRQNMQLLSEESSLCPSQFFCPRLFS